MAGVAISLQRPTALILTVSPKTRFYQYMMRGVVATSQSVEQILGHVTQSTYPQTVFEGKGQNWTQNWKMFHIYVVARNALGKLRGGSLAYTFVAFETKFASFVFSTVCSYLTLFTLPGLNFSEELSIVSEV